MKVRNLRRPRRVPMDYSLAYVRYLLRETPVAPRPRAHGLKPQDAALARREVHRLFISLERGEAELREITTVAMTR